jgi:tetratricopeptide (TPR) repeat protein
LAIAALAIVLLLPIHKVASYDAWFHLRAGEWLLAGGGFPSEDPFSFTAQHRWINLSWLYQIPLALAHRLGGIPAVTLFNTLLLLLTFGLIGWMGRQRGWRLADLAVVLALAALASSQRLFVRPESVSLLCVAVALLLTERALRGHPKALWGFLPLQAVWVNSEALFPLGICILGAGLVEAFRRNRIARRTRLRGVPGATPLRPWLLALAGAAGVSLLNPYGLQGAVFPLRLARLVTDPGNIFCRGIAELKSPFDPQVPVASVLFLFLFVGCLLLFLLLRYRRVDWFAVLLLIGFGYLAARSVRNAPLLALVGSFTVLRLPAPSDLHGGRLRTGTRLGLAALFLFLVVGIVTSSFQATFRLGKQFGLDVDTRFFPEETLCALREVGPPERIMNDHALGHYVIWRLGPRTRVFLDGRSEVYGEERLSSFQSAFADAAVFDRFAEQFAVSFALLGHRQQYLHPLLGGLSRHPRWQLIAYDHAAALFSRMPEAQRLGDVVLPDSFEIPAPRARGFVRRWFDPGPRDATERHLEKAQMLLTVGRPAESALEALAAARATPWSADAFNQLGAGLFRTNRFAEARRAFIACLAIDPSYTEAMMNMGVSALAAKQFEEAERWLREGLRAGAGGTGGHLYLGKALKGLGRESEAREAFLAAARAQPEHSKAYLELGSLTYREGRNREAAASRREAAGYYREAAGYYREGARRGERFLGLWGAGVCLAAGEWLDEARATLEEALSAAPDDAARTRVRTLLGQIDDGTIGDGEE